MNQNITQKSILILKSLAGVITLTLGISSFSEEAKVVPNPALNTVSNSLSKKINLDTATMVSLKQNTNKIDILVNYPGADISGLCAVEIRFKYADNINDDSKISKLKESLKVTNKYSSPNQIEIKNGKTLRIPLNALGGYVEWITLQFNDNANFAKSLAQIAGEANEVVLVGETCNN